MIKADDKVKFEGVTEPATFTNFEELKKRVEILQENLDEIAEILRQHNLFRTDKIDAPYFDEDRIYRELEDGA